MYRYVQKTNTVEKDISTICTEDQQKKIGMYSSNRESQKNISTVYVRQVRIKIERKRERTIETERMWCYSTGMYPMHLLYTVQTPEWTP